MLDDAGRSTGSEGIDLTRTLMVVAEVGSSDQSATGLSPVTLNHGEFRACPVPMSS